MRSDERGPYMQKIVRLICAAKTFQNFKTFALETSTQHEDFIFAVLIVVSVKFFANQLESRLLLEEARNERGVQFRP